MISTELIRIVHSVMEKGGFARSTQTRHGYLEAVVVVRECPAAVIL
jgi:hypothetical protein